MPQPLSPEELDALARKRASAKLGWYLHALVYVLVNAVVFALSRYAFGTRPWSVYPLIGWGLGLALHGVSVFVLGKGGSLRERMIQREREAIERRQQNRP